MAERLRSFIALVLVCLAGSSSALDYGFHGPVFPVEEPSLLEIIQDRLREMDANGELAAMQEEMVETTRSRVLRPLPVVGIGKAQEYRIFEVDLTITVKEDIADHRGVVFARAGTVINPLDHSRFSKRLIFIDGDDPEQVEFALMVASEHPAKIILINGEPITLSNANGVPFWFDQQAVLSDRFLIERVPSIVSRGYPNMIVEEIPLPLEEG